jgi:hypothetical protein
MALATTTLGSAVLVGDQSIIVASATSVSAGRMVRIDDEWMKVRADYVSGTTVPVLRGLNGSVVAAHPSSANVTHGLHEDFDNAPDQNPLSVIAPGLRSRKMLSYSASGAITLPQAGEDMVAVLNGTSALAMTVADPPKDIDGSLLIVIGNGKSQSTVTYASGLGNAGASYDVITFQNAGLVSFSAMACNGFWVALNTPITGTSTSISVAIA